MKTIFINDIIQMMLPHMNNAQCEALQEVLQHVLFQYDLVKHKDCCAEEGLFSIILSAKRIEGCSEKSLKYYESTIQKLLGNTWEIC
mgnify:CR=1 FL=1